MIDFNWTEILALAIIGVIMFGPEKLPEFARKAARVVAYLRRVGNDARGQLRAELGPEFDDLKLSDLNPKNFVGRVLSAEDQQNLLDIRDELKGVGTMASEGLDDVRTNIESQPVDEPVAVPVPAYRPPFDPEAT
ncbi:sec-independent translocase [Propioniciclava tarda]|uniref:Sec-independent protein translocase subunit TatB n=1 Tax=Propioniciclava tarda TaxID=433330 RepID=A0A4Q9KKX6_PROTD|nr:sec-independent translocase [Propioniciclava tarda]TBT94309.1 Sec-independent protein translocase subunit TatB [Propioniciclava tarda]SMO73981.1 sec-independent protein translocase protein TatB [Propioniciclava tarda]HQA31329.1 sec-independent translocase [Propioniciclava tarda]HQD61106.1 sec-independent translocase [Propioniciclava tarda]